MQKNPIFEKWKEKAPVSKKHVVIRCFHQRFQLQLSGRSQKSPRRANFELFFCRFKGQPFSKFLEREWEEEISLCRNWYVLNKHQTSVKTSWKSSLCYWTSVFFYLVSLQDALARGLAVKENLKCHGQVSQVPVHHRVGIQWCLMNCHDCIWLSWFSMKILMVFFLKRKEAAMVSWWNSWFHILFIPFPHRRNVHDGGRQTNCCPFLLPSKNLVHPGALFYKPRFDNTLNGLLKSGGDEVSDGSDPGPFRLRSAWDGWDGWDGAGDAGKPSRGDSEGRRCQLRSWKHFTASFPSFPIFPIFPDLFFPYFSTYFSHLSFPYFSPSHI